MDSGQDGDFEQRVEAEVQRRLALRARRRLPWLVAGAALAVLALGGGAWAGWQAWSRLGQDLDRRNQEFARVREAYQAELARNQEWQRSRAQAEQGAKYQPGRTQAQHEAAEMANLISLVGKATAFKRRIDKGSASGAATAEELTAWADETDALLGEAMGSIGRVILRNTDPGERPQTTLLMDRASASGAARR